MTALTPRKPLNQGRTAQRFMRKIGPVIELIMRQGICNLELTDVSRAGWRLTFDYEGCDGVLRRGELDASASMTRILKEPESALLTHPQLMLHLPHPLESTAPSPTARSSVECWSCSNTVTLEARSMNDGLCPVCDAEIELYE
jgi:hypothetical protein